MKTQLMALGLAAALSAPAAAQVGVGDPAPDIAGEWTGAEVHSLAECRGRVVLIEFWRTW